MDGQLTYEEQIESKIVQFKNSLAATKSEIDGLIEKSTDICDKYLECSIENADQLERVQFDMKELSKHQKGIEDTRKTVTVPISDCKDVVMNYIRPSKTEAVKAKEITRKEIMRYSDKIETEKREKERERQKQIEEEKRKLRLAAELKDQEVMREQVKELEKIEEIQKEEKRVAPKIDKRSIRKRWRAKVIDEDMVPDEYWVIGTQLLDRVARESEGKVEVPGVLFYPE